MISEISKRYAKALYDLSKSNKTEETVFSQIRELKSVFSDNKDISDFINNPLISPDQKLSVITKALGGRVAEDLFNFMKLLAEKNRLSYFSETVDAYEVISDEAHGVTRGIIRSAATLSADAQEQMEATIKKVTGKEVILTFKEDPSLIGGMIAQVGGWTFDDSLESHLKRMSEDLNRRTN